LLGDFSVAARIHFRKRKNYGTYAFSSPELCETSDDNSHTTDLDPKACDMWALGVTIFLLFKGSIPYYTKNPQVNIRSIEVSHDKISFRNFYITFVIIPWI
jgi:serine/threonine protein kinase